VNAFSGESPVFQGIHDITTFYARERGEKTALHFPPDGSLSYSGLDDRVRRFSAFLKQLDLPSPACVGILLPNTPEFVIAYFGAIASGNIAVPVNYRLSPAEVGYILSDCSAPVVVTTKEQWEKVSMSGQAAGVSVWILIDGEGSGATSFTHAIRRKPMVSSLAFSPDDVAVLLYTSGTTGFPKGAMISHRNTLFNVSSCRSTLGYGGDDIGLLTLPLFHVTGLHSQLVALLACGATLVLQREYDTRRMLELVSEYRVTSLFLVPAVYKLITLREDLGSFDLSSVRVAAYGGAPMAPETIESLTRIFPAELHNCYGLTECSSLGTVLPSQLVFSHPESVGLPVPGTEAQVRGESGEPLSPGAIGELYLRGPNIVKGYFRAPEKTRDAIVDGWLRTGDIAQIDEKGLVYILDRAKDMINRGGEKIYGLEVENVLYAIPGVAEAAVVGVHHPIFGEVPVAYVVSFPDTVLDEGKIREFCRSRLADYKVPVRVCFTDRLPRNPGGKVVKQELRRAWEAEPKEECR